MLTGTELQLKSDCARARRRNFTVKIMVTKKAKPKRPPRTADPLLQLHKEMENNLKGIRQHKTKIEELTKATIDELKRLHDETKRATIHVTHDFKEALDLADRIAVIRDGRIIQVSEPDDLIRRPKSKFVAEFVDAKKFLTES